MTHGRDKEGDVSERCNEVVMVRVAARLRGRQGDRGRPRLNIEAFCTNTYNHTEH